MAFVECFEYLYRGRIGKGIMVWIIESQMGKSKNV